MTDFAASCRKPPIQTSGSYSAWALGAGAVDMAWHSRAGAGAQEDHTLLPFTEPSIALRRWVGAEGHTEAHDFLIFRSQSDGGHYVPQAGEELFALRLAPELMEAAFDLKASEHALNDTEVPSALLELLSDARRRADAGDFPGAWKEMFDSLAAASRDCEPDRLALAAGLARRSRGRLGPSELAGLAGLSARHMRRGFTERFGLSPRAILRRQRVTAAMLSAERQEQPHWADLAALHNFSDQSHMIRECRELIGASPRQWHEKRRGLAVSFNT